MLRMLINEYQYPHIWTVGICPVAHQSMLYSSTYGNSIQLASTWPKISWYFVVCSRYISIYLSIFQFENRIYRILPRFALSIYLRAQIHQKVIQCFVDLGQIDQIVAYVGNPSWQLRWCCVARCWVVGFQGKRMEMGLLNRFDPVEEIMLVVAMVRKTFLRSSVLKCCWCG
jgi:hypothetical protein